MYVFNKITVTPQLPKRIEKLSEIANNLWWSWNIDFLKLFKNIDNDLWETVDKNPVKFLKLVSQERLEQIAGNQDFLKEYDKISKNFEDYMNSKNTWFNKTYPDNRNDLIAYYSAEYGLDRILSIYSGGLGILSADHLKAASDLGIPLVAIGILYKQGFFRQKIDGEGKESIKKALNFNNKRKKSNEDDTIEAVFVCSFTEKECKYIIQFYREIKVKYEKEFGGYINSSMTVGFFE